MSIAKQNIYNAPPLQWRRNEPDGVSNHQPHDCLLNGFIQAQIKQTSKLRVAGLCEGNSPVTGEFPALRASNAENIPLMTSSCHNETSGHWSTVCDDNITIQNKL